jgi:hypothetical protein
MHPHTLKLGQAREYLQMIGYLLAVAFFLQDGTNRFRSSVARLPLPTIGVSLSVILYSLMLRVF